MCHSTWGKASKCFVPGYLKAWEEGKRRGQGPHGVRMLAVTTCQALGLPCGPSMAERQGLLCQALCPGGQYLVETDLQVARGKWRLRTWGQLGAGVKQRGDFTAVMKGQQFTQETGEEGPPAGRKGRYRAWDPT